MSELTNADSFELVDAQYRKKPLGEDAYHVDVTDDISIDRWTKYGKDRLYLNGLKTGDGWISLKTGESGGDRWTKVSAEYELDGDELTITVGNDQRRPTYTLVIRVHGEEFESADEDEDGDENEEENEGEQEIVADGGEDVTSHVSDTDIEEAINQHDDPEHPDAATVEDVRDVLASIQRSIEDYWSEHMDTLEGGDLEVVHEDDDVVVLADHTGYGWMEELDAAGVEDDVLRQIVKSVHHEVARDRCDYRWSASDPFVVRKPDGFDAGQRYVEAVVNGLQQRGLSPGQAWAYYGVEIRDNSMNSWGLRKGDHDHKNVSDALEKAKAKLP